MAATKLEMMNFSKEIEQLSKDKELNYIEAVVYYCEKIKGIEVESVIGLINGPMKTKLANVAGDLHLVKKKKKS